jgi:hypothetical protein
MARGARHVPPRIELASVLEVLGGAWCAARDVARERLAHPHGRVGYRDVAHYVVPVTVCEHHRGGTAELGRVRRDRVELAQEVRRIDDDAAGGAAQERRRRLPDAAREYIDLHG